jgi:lipoate-protein ligase A
MDAAVSRAVLDRVGAGDLPETLRLYVPERLVAFGSRDAVNPAFDEARQAAAEVGFGSYLRLAGGKAAVFHEHTIAFGWAIPTDDPRSTIGERFDEIGDLLTAAMTRLGVQARLGEVPGEYCPGSHSINARGAVKLAGIGQRLVNGAAHVGGVVVVDRSDLVNRALVPVYRTLGYSWDPSTTGAITEETDADLDDALAAITSVFEERHELSRTSIDDTTLRIAQAADATGPR